MIIATDPDFGRKAEAPEDYGRHHSRCSRCGAWLCRFHDPDADGGLCWPCAPGGPGIVIEVEPGEWRRVSLEEVLPPNPRELMEAA